MISPKIRCEPIQICAAVGISGSCLRPLPILVVTMLGFLGVLGGSIGQPLDSGPFVSLRSLRRSGPARQAVPSRLGSEEAPVRKP
jgi:hypothetical protein